MNRLRFRQLATLIVAVALMGTGMGGAVASEGLTHSSGNSNWATEPGSPQYSWVAESAEDVQVDRLAATPSEVWGACGIFDGSLKVIRAFKGRSQAHIDGKSITYGGSNLTCGNESWGYRHILKRHLSEWQSRAAVAQENWRDTADYGIHWALRDPDKITYRASNDTFCYSRKILLIDNRTKETVGSYYPKVSVARASHRIITAYPSGAQC